MERRIFRRSVYIQEEEQMFLGQFEHTIDDKGRMTIPARYRELLVDGAYITQGFDQNLIVLTPVTFDQISQRVNKMNMADPLARQLRRLIFSNADRVDADKLGRILIPSYLRQSAELETTAVVVGVGSHFEIWSSNLWNKQSEILRDSEANQQRFSVLDLTIG